MSETSPLLADEQPLIVLPSLVRFVGDHVAAMLLQQIHFRSRVGQDHDGYRWAVLTNEQWCDEVVMKKTQFDRCIKTLTDKGVLISVQVMKSQYDRTAWRRIDYSRMPVNERVESGQSELTDSTRSSSTQEEKENTVAIATDRAPASPSEQLFEQWWKMYPRKAGKKTAGTVWRNLKVRDRTAAMDGLPRWVEYWRKSKTEERYIRHAATWLRGECWNDLPPSSGSAAPVGFREPDEMWADGDNVWHRYPEHEYR